MTKRDKQIRKEHRRRLKGIVADLKSGRYLGKPDCCCETLEKMFRDCGRPIKFSDVFTTELDCVATDKCQSKPETIRRK